MMSSGSVCRLLADALAQLTNRLSPPGRQAWGRAMAAEQRYIENHVEALRWAAGCLCANLLAQVRDGALLDHRLVRWSIASWAGYQAENNLCTTLVLISSRLHIHELTALVARWCAGDDLRSLEPVLNAVSTWEVGLGLVAIVLYALAAALLVTHRIYGARSFVAALGICSGLWLYELSKPIYFDAFTLGEHLQDAALYGLTGLIAWVAWTGAPRRGDGVWHSR